MLSNSLFILLFLSSVRESHAELTVKTTEGENAVMSCSTKPGTSVSWQYRSRNSTEGDRYLCIAGKVMPDYAAKLTLTGNSNGDFTLTINSVTVNSDAGVYTCIEDDGLGHKTSIRLDVYQKEKVKIQSLVETTEGQLRSNQSVQIAVQWAIIVFILIVVIASVSVNIVVLRKMCIVRRSRRNEKRLIDRGDDKVPAVVPVRVLLEGGDEIIGVARIDQQLILLRRREKKHLQFYSTIDPRTTDFKPQREISVPGLDVDKWYNDIVACAKNRCLYISDRNNRSIHRVPVVPSDANKPNIWYVLNQPRSLSLTADHNVLVTYREAMKLQELNSTDGQVKDDIQFQAVMEMPWHAIKLSTGQYVVSYGLRHRSSFNVSIVNRDGAISTIKYTYNRVTSSLNEPYHLAVDARCFIYVTDYRNNRVLVLNDQLKYVLHLKSDELRKPFRLCLDNSTNQLYIGQWNGTLTCAELRREDGQNMPAAV